MTPEQHNLLASWAENVNGYAFFGPDEAEAVRAALSLIDAQHAALKALLALAENCEHQIEGEWGMCRTLAKMEADGDLAEEILQARAVIARCKR